MPAPSTPERRVRDVVVVGYGMAAHRLVARLTESAAPLRVTVFGAEAHPTYNRVLLSSVLTGSLTGGATYLGDHRDPRLTVYTGLEVVAVDRDRRLVHTADGTHHPYDALVLATGSVSTVPPVRGIGRCDGSLLPGVVAFRTIEDCQAIIAAARHQHRAVVVGGGLLGIEAARGLGERGVQVDLVHAAPHLMERQLDPAAARVLARTLAGLGVRIRIDRRVVRVHGGDRVTAVVLDDGTVLPTGLVVLACGTRPDTRLAAAAGLPLGRVSGGVVVDDTLASPADPAVYATGDCAEHRGVVYGLVAPAWEQADVVAARLVATRPVARYAGSRTVTRLKARGVDLAAMGESHAEDGQECGDVEVLHFAHPKRGVYKKLVLRHGRVVGAILLGDVDSVGTVTRMFDQGTPAPEDRLTLLFTGPRADAEPVAHHRVCHCNDVTRAAVATCWDDGARTVAAVAARTRATTGCGSCHDTLAALLVELQASRGEAVPASGVG